MVQRIKPFKGNEKVLKRILCHFKLDGKVCIHYQYLNVIYVITSIITLDYTYHQVILLIYNGISAYYFFQTGEIVILKNIPEINAMLYKIKHLIKITPIRTPDGLPPEGDLYSGYLKDNGEFVVSQKLKPNLGKLELTQEFQTEPGRLDAETLIKQSRYKWLNPW